jgi:hypothetical protein
MGYGISMIRVTFDHQILTVKNDRYTLHFGNDLPGGYEKDKGALRVAYILYENVEDRKKNALLHIGSGNGYINYICKAIIDGVYIEWYDYRKWPQMACGVTVAGEYHA